MAKSSKKSDLKKPHPDFPLFPHKGTNRWAKKVKGKIHYFGQVLPADPKGEKALDVWLDQKDDLLAGRTPRAKGAGLTVADLANHFLTFKQELRDSGGLAPRSYGEYCATCEMVVGAFGKNRLVDDLAANDFQALRARFAKRFGPVRLGHSIQRVRSLFKYGYEAGLIDKPPRFGPGFKKPSAKTIRKSRAASGPRMFEADELRRLLDHATPNMRAMILLGVNGGLGNTDVAELTTKGADIKSPAPSTTALRGAGGLLGEMAGENRLRAPLGRTIISAVMTTLNFRHSPHPEWPPTDGNRQASCSARSAISTPGGGRTCQLVGQFVQASGQPVLLVRGYAGSQTGSARHRGGSTTSKAAPFTRRSSSCRTGMRSSGATEIAQSMPLSATNMPYFCKPRRIVCTGGEKPERS